MVFLFFLNNLM